MAVYLSFLYGLLIHFDIDRLIHVPGFKHGSPE